MAIHDKNEKTPNGKPSDGKTEVEMLSGLAAALMQELVDAGVTPQQIFENGLFNEGYPITPSLNKINELSENSKAIMDSIAKKAIEPVLEQMRKKEQNMETQTEQTKDEIKPESESTTESVNSGNPEPSVFSFEKLKETVNSYIDVAQSAFSGFKKGIKTA